MLVTDVTLLDGSGTALARSARAVRPELAVVVMSGSDELDGVFDIAIAKPFDGGGLPREGQGGGYGPNEGTPLLSFVTQASCTPRPARGHAFPSPVTWESWNTR